MYQFDIDNEVESNYGAIYSISRGVIVAEKMGGATMYEMVRVGSYQILGEIIGLEGDNAIIHLFEEAAGCQVGDVVMRTKMTLYVELAPGIMTNVFDGIQRSLRDMSEDGSIYLKKGYKEKSLSRSKKWHFIPSPSINDHIIGGDIIGEVKETKVMIHKIIIPPNVMGTITFIAKEGDYSIDEPIYEIEFNDQKKEYGMLQYWPVRTPRPFVSKIPSFTPLATGFRIVDTLFPAIRGGKIAIPGAYGAGKSHILYQIAKYSKEDCSFIISCGERGNELCETIMESPCITLEKNGKEYSVMEQTSMIVNTANMPVAGREASIFTGITLAEYYRDMGYNVCVTADSTSRWAEALYELSYRFSQLSSAEKDYPALLNSRLNSFYGRAGKVECLGNPNRTGAITILGSVSPAGGDFSDPVVRTTFDIVQTFWALDKKIAQIKHFPSINWDVSFSSIIDEFDQYYNDEIDSEFVPLRNRCRELLREESTLSEMVHLAGYDCLSETEKLQLEITKIIRQDFLQQNGFSEYDRYCPLFKAFWMLRNIFLVFDLAKKVIEGKKMKFLTLKSTLKDLFYNVSCMKFQIPRKDNKDELVHFYQLFHQEIINTFDQF